MKIKNKIFFIFIMDFVLSVFPKKVETGLNNVLTAEIEQCIPDLLKSLCDNTKLVRTVTGFKLCTQDTFTCCRFLCQNTPSNYKMVYTQDSLLLTDFTNEFMTLGYSNISIMLIISNSNSADEFKATLNIECS